MNEHVNRFSELIASNWLAVAASTLRVLLILMAAWFGAIALRRLIRLFRVRMSARLTNSEALKRAETLGRVLRYTVTVVVTLIAGVLVLNEMGISVAPILGAAGVVGLAVGFGAQSLVKDYFVGFFLLLENQIRQGDVVAIADSAGLVEEVTLRYVRLRDYNGNVHFVPNGLITKVTNMSREYAHAVVDIGIAYREAVDEALATMREVAEAMRADAVFASKIVEPVEMVGVERWDDSAIVLRCRFKVMPLEQWNVRREFLRRLKQAFDARGIEIPFPHVTVYAGTNKDGSAPPFYLRRALVEKGRDA